MNFGIPQVIYIVLTAAGFVMVLMKHGQPKEGKYDIVTSTISQIFILALLWWGGFF